jgi:hypothetical protein
LADDSNLKQKQATEIRDNAAGSGFNSISSISMRYCPTTTTTTTTTNNFKFKAISLTQIHQFIMN